MHKIQGREMSKLFKYHADNIETNNAFFSKQIITTIWSDSHSIKSRIKEMRRSGTEDL